ncbi:hypothetical protein DC3_51600 [Deinococcus cellulosilyticus NBRC 106333 = KACC 11606]|uniref:Uncharacterized protein n=1 Tax=Deinococcus cellulosilyticus (strain DSM 18568 / NBRC 106333 / KACC 11606 / 5516J-15) TaxID=1223518 RepID=A0A511N9M0_DEIC1|nr:hypothetical protein DC3_51600 [Deinococcus cellulosilyticus NBRC 106333 = KACC 11606]
MQFQGVLFNNDPGSKVAIHCGNSQVPVTLLLDQKGTIVSPHLGEIDFRTMQGVLSSLGVKL